MTKLSYEEWKTKTSLLGLLKTSFAENKIEDILMEEYQLYLSKEVNLTPEQIKTLEDAFANYPEDFPTTSPYASIEGVQEQIKISLEQNPEFTTLLIFYISKVDMNDKNHPRYTLEKMVIGDHQSKAMEESIVGAEPTHTDIEKRMELTGESYYTAREELREQAYGGTHSKSPSQSWGDFWKTY